LNIDTELDEVEVDDEDEDEDEVVKKRKDNLKNITLYFLTKRCLTHHKLYYLQ